MVATAVATNDSMQRAIHDAMAQSRIMINIQAQMSPDGIATRATAQQDSRSAATPVVRVNNNRANV
jgi:hypothetical protein